MLRITFSPTSLLLPARTFGCPTSELAAMLRIPVSQPSLMPRAHALSARQVADVLHNATPLPLSGHSRSELLALLPQHLHLLFTPLLCMLAARQDCG